MAVFVLFSKIPLKTFASRVTNSEDESFQDELDNIRKFLRVDSDQTEIALKQVEDIIDRSLEYLFSRLQSSVLIISGRMPMQLLILELERNRRKI